MEPLATDYEGVRMRKLRETLLFMINKTLGTLTQAKFKEIFKSLPEDVSPLLNQLRNDFQKNVEEEFEEIVKENDLKSKFNHLDDLILQYSKNNQSSANVLDVLNAEDIQIDGIDHLPELKEDPFESEKRLRITVKKEKMKELEQRLNELEQENEELTSQISKQQQEKKEMASQIMEKISSIHHVYETVVNEK
eukprot:TRINITY_DN6153_c0_g1_i1.p1 TRINITY_DN6153_c0_g1~~TRINITY_DN6153_c0_g1_i1.p1  ORF type:complete len:193 (-),score=85.31 TRINITY_DN6153_c0_g1_i1:181-759(-)